MQLFSPSIIEDVRRISGARHSFLRQIAETDGSAVRQYLSDQAALAAPGVAQRVDVEVAEEDELGVRPEREDVQLEQREAPCCW